MTDKIRLDPEELTPGDLKRARVALEGQNPWEMLEDPIDAMILAIWCLKSRSDPTFTFEQAENTRLGDFDMGDAVPPPTEPPAASGGSPGRNGKPASAEKPTVSGAAPSS